MISVLLTTYNAAEYLPFSIRSILNQTHKNFELLIIDDGSDDNTQEIVESFRDNRIKYIKIQHAGRSKALNKGLNICRYDWVALIDADDIAHPRRLEKQFLKNLNSNEIVITSCVYFENMRPIFKIDVRNLTFPRDLILHQPFPNSVIYNRNFILENGGYDENINVAEDYELWLRIMNKVKFISVNETLMFYRNTKNSLSRKNIQKTNREIYKIQQPFYDDLGKHFNIADEKTKNIYRGWREYFFGSPSLARRYWIKPMSILFNIRILLAFLMTFFPVKFIEKFKQSEVKLRLNYLFKKINGENKSDELEIKNILKSI